MSLFRWINSHRTRTGATNMPGKGETSPRYREGCNFIWNRYSLRYNIFLQWLWACKEMPFVRRLDCCIRFVMFLCGFALLCSNKVIIFRPHFNTLSFYQLHFVTSIAVNIKRHFSCNASTLKYPDLSITMHDEIPIQFAHMLIKVQ